MRRGNDSWSQPGQAAAIWTGAHPPSHGPASLSLCPATCRPIPPCSHWLKPGPGQSCLVDCHGKRWGWAWRLLARSWGLARVSQPPPPSPPGSQRHLNSTTGDYLLIRTKSRTLVMLPSGYPTPVTYWCQKQKVDYLKATLLVALIETWVWARTSSNCFQGPLEFRPRGHVVSILGWDN